MSKVSQLFGLAMISIANVTNAMHAVDMGKTEVTKNWLDATTSVLDRREAELSDNGKHPVLGFFSTAIATPGIIAGATYGRFAPKFKL
jgi:hypothetical protein